MKIHIHNLAGLGGLAAGYGSGGVCFQLGHMIGFIGIRRLSRNTLSMVKGARCGAALELGRGNRNRNAHREPVPLTECEPNTEAPPRASLPPGLPIIRILPRMTGHQLTESVSTRVMPTDLSIR